VVNLLCPYGLKTLFVNQSYIPGFLPRYGRSSHKTLERQRPGLNCMCLNTNAASEWRHVVLLEAGILFGWKKPTCRALFIYQILRIIQCGPGSSVGIATELRAGQSGIKSRWGQDFPPVQTGSGAHPASCKIGTGFFLGVKCGRGVLLTIHPL